MSEFPPTSRYNRRNKLTAIVAACAINFGASACVAAVEAPVAAQTEAPSIDFEKETVRVTTEQVLRSLGSLAITGRAPKTGYSPEQFGSWRQKDGCDTRDVILIRDLDGITLNSVTCEVLTGTLVDPYSGEVVPFERGENSGDVQIDHVVSRSNAWQMSPPEFRSDTKAAYQNRVDFANDPVNLRAVKGEMNNEKSDGDIATWEPPKKDFLCEFAAQQVIVKDKYNLRVTQAEHDTFVQILTTCPNEEFAIPN